MAKKQVTSDKILNKFQKPQFAIGDVVFFCWLGQKQYGHVQKIKQTNWGIQYTVRNHQEVRYPCGISIQGQTTSYSIGYIYYDETKSKGQEELQRLYDAARTNECISGNAGGAKSQSGDDGENGRRNDSKDIVPVSDGGNNGRKHDVKSGTNGVPRNTKQKSKTTRNDSLETAIDRQRAFLNGFVKKD